MARDPVGLYTGAVICGQAIACAPAIALTVSIRGSSRPPGKRSIMRCNDCSFECTHDDIDEMKGVPHAPR